VTLPDGAGAIGLLDSLNLQVAQSSGIHRMIFQLVVQDDTLEVVKPLVVGRSVETVEETDGSSQATVTELNYPDQFRLILSSQERDLFDDLDDDSRVRFYASYWLGRDADMAAFEQRCVESERYSRAFSEGWRTDRGRVYIIFGAPNDIEAVPLVIDRIPHEIWYYYGSGSSERFVFADRTGTGDYEQIFSTVEGETSYSNWEDMLAPVTSGSASGGSTYQP
jgi:GWxTD domain-containing protein